MSLYYNKVILCSCGVILQCVKKSFFLGFKLSVHHHLDQPIMSIKEIDISVGSESQVAVATTLTTTTEQAQYRFDPVQRGCYFEGELFLKFLPKEFYR